MALRRVIGFWEALAINLGAIVGAGIFVIRGIAAGIAGPSAIIAIAIGAVVSIFTGLSFAQLSHAYSSEGGNYEYAKRQLGNYAGVVVGLMFILSSIVGGAVVALSFGSYFASLAGSGIGAIAVAVLLIACLGAVNYLGVKSTALTSAALTVIKLAILAFFILVGIFYIKPANYVPFLPNGFGSLFEATAFIFFAYTGFARVTTMGEEIREPKKTIPRAIIYSILISAIVYAVVMFVIIGLVPYGSLAASQSPLAFAMLSATGNREFEYVISIGALFATVNVALSMILGVSRVAFAMSRDGNLPRSLSRLNRFGTPGMAIIVPTLIMMLAAATMDFRQIASLSNAAALLSYSLANVAAIKLTIGRHSDPKKMFFRSRYFAAVPILGVASAAVLISFLTSLSLYLLLAILAAITIYYIAAARAKGPNRR